MTVSTDVIRKQCLLLFLTAGCLLLCIALGQADDKPVFEVRKYGARGDGKNPDTTAVQAAIDAAYAAGGGRVVLAPGQYLCGTVFLKSHVTLRLEKSATLLGSPDAKDYQAVGMFIDGVGAQRGFALIGAIDATDIALEGQGTIDGQGKSLARTKQRPFLLRFSQCKNLSISGLALDNAASWNCNLMDCDVVRIKDVTINSTGGGNNDGIDVDSCRDVQITGCNITSGDDSICLKSTLPKPCRDITISDCKIASGWGAFKFGTESMGPFENIKISDCTITKARGGIKLYSVDGAKVRNILISNLTMENVDQPIIIRLGSRLKTFHAGDKPQEIGSIEDVTIRHIRANGVSSPMVKPTNAITVGGIPNHRIKGVVLEDIHLTIEGGGAAEQTAREVPEKEKNYPELNMFGPLPAYGVYLRHAEAITLSGVSIETRAPDLRHLVYCDDANDVQLMKVRAKPAAGAAAWLRVEGSQSGTITLSDCDEDLSHVSLGAGVPRDAVRVKQ